MFKGTKGIIPNIINVEHIINTLDLLGYKPKLKHIFKDNEYEGQGDAIVVINHGIDGTRELFVLWNYMDHYKICPNSERTILNLGCWGNSVEILEDIVSQLGGGYLIRNDKKEDWHYVKSSIISD